MVSVLAGSSIDPYGMSGELLGSDTTGTSAARRDETKGRSLQQVHAGEEREVHSASKPRAKRYDHLRKGKIKGGFDYESGAPWYLYSTDDDGPIGEGGDVVRVPLFRRVTVDNGHRVVHSELG